MTTHSSTASRATAGRATASRAAANTVKVVRFNWPKYLAALALAAAAPAAGSTGAPGWARGLLWAACVPGCAWTLTSLAATWWAYDHHRVYEQLTTGLPGPGQWAVVHAGFDDSLPALRAAIGYPPAAVAQVPVRAGASLRRARRQGQCTATSVTALPEGALDALFVTFAAHEVRSEHGQRALFAALRRALRPGGILVITEHSRDAANFAVYGPGALHFQPLATWHARAAEAGLAVHGQVSITPFVTRAVYQRC